MQFEGRDARSLCKKARSESSGNAAASGILTSILELREIIVRGDIRVVVVLHLLWVRIG